MAPSPLPTYLYKILPGSERPPSPLPARLATTPLDAGDGFIHLSTAAQIPLTARLFFAEDSSLYLLKIRREALEGRIEWTTDEGNGGARDGCPHVFGCEAGLGRGNVVEVVHVPRPEGEAWAENGVLKALEG